MENHTSSITAIEQCGADPGSIQDIAQNLYTVYGKSVLPLEKLFRYNDFRPSWFEETIHNQRPLVTVFGAYSSGKTTFINYLLQDDYMLTGPQPTTDSFTAVIYGEKAASVDGYVLMNSRDYPFKGLCEFGESFQQRFQGFQAPHPLLQRITFVDTPGILEGAANIRERGYDYMSVARWFAERSDLILVFFDPTKLDSGSGLKMLFKQALAGQVGKTRIVMNKADNVTTQELLRVYGSLFWNLSNVIRTTEPPRVFIGSFWNEPYKKNTFAPLFIAEKAQLLNEIIDILPHQTRNRKVASVLRRAKDVHLHALIVATMRGRLPKVFGKSKAKSKLLDSLTQLYDDLAYEYKFNLGDFPDVDEYKKFLEKRDLEEFPDLKDASKAITETWNCTQVTLPSYLRLAQNVAAHPHDAKTRQDILRLYVDHARLSVAARADTAPTPAPALQPVQTHMTNPLLNDITKCNNHSKSNTISNTLRDDSSTAPTTVSSTTLVNGQKSVSKTDCGDILVDAAAPPPCNGETMMLKAVQYPEDDSKLTIETATASTQ